MATAESAAYDELLDLFVEPAVAERVLAFHPSAAMQARIEAQGFVGHRCPRDRR